MSAQLIDYAKDQACNVASVNHKAPWIYVASSLYRTSSRKQLRFYWEDPPLDDREPTIKLEADRDTWWRYYLPIRELVREFESDPASFEQQFGFVIELREEVKRFMNVLDAGDQAFQTRREELEEWSRNGRDKQDQFWNADGVGLKITADRISQ